MAPEFTWWHANGDGTATAYPDTREVRDRIDSGERGWFGSIEGAILHGGVIAIAYRRKTERVYGAAHWLRTGELLPAGYVTTTTITAGGQHHV